MANHNKTIGRNPNSTTGMARSYNSNSLPQLSAIESSIPFIRKAIDVLEIDSSSFPVIIADFGSAHVIHNDLPTNDWTTLFGVLNQDNSYYGLSSGRSFYEQCLPSNFVTVGYSSHSIHWLSRKPGNISNHCLSLFAQGEEYTAFQLQAQEDYEKFLKNRSRELRRGGVLILTILSVDEERTTPIDFSYHQLYRCAKQLPLSEEELLDYTLPGYLRSYKECLDEELFKRCSLQLIASNFCKIKSKFCEDFQQGKITIEQLAQLHTDFIRSWSESIIRRTLEANGKRSKEVVNQLLEQFWLLYKQQMQEKPEECTGDSYQTYLVLKKV